MPRPTTREITFSIDGREVRAIENSMLVDAAKNGDVEIPVFCYEPKLGQPVGACRMCLVEVEGIPKLQTACSTAVKDGMVVHTQTERVRDAQKAVVEFLLINHPLDCPVCDKGGECPLQDITYGWGPGTSRFVEPKRHFQKPLFLSPLIAIDRERCILCYRCVRFSQEVSEDYQLILHERGADTYVATFDGHPYVGPFAGNITELCPVGALLPTTYRFRARPWDIEGAGSVCTMCPSQCNVELTVRDEKVMRVMARDNVEVDDGWLCDKGRFAFQAMNSDDRILEPMVREGATLMPASWEKALSTAAAALKKAGPRAGALAGDGTTNEEAFLLQRLFREGLGSGLLSSGSELPRDVARSLADPGLSAKVADLEFAHAVLLLGVDPVDAAPVFDLRIRKGIRRRGVRLAVASARPTALDPRAEAVLRFSPGTTEAALVALDAALAGDTGNLGGAATAANSTAHDVQAFADFLSGAGEDVVIVYGEGALSAAAGRALLNVATRLGLSGRDGAGLIGIPGHSNGRGIREAGCAFGWGPGYDEVEAAEEGADPSVMYLLHADPIRYGSDREAWERRLGAAQTVIAHAAFLSEGLRDHADVIFPAEIYPEKEGTVTHPDGRLQRLRVAVGRPGPLDAGVRATWHVIADLSARCGHDLGVVAGPQASKQLFDAVPFYRRLTLDEIGGKGVRWPERSPESFASWELARLQVPDAPPNGGLRVGRHSSLWASPEVEHSPSLQFLEARQVIELAPDDASRAGVRDGDRVRLGPVEGVGRLRAAVPAGTAFVVEGTTDSPANALTDPVATLERVAGNGHDPSAAPVVSTPATEGLAEMPPSAPLDLPPTQTHPS